MPKIPNTKYQILSTIPRRCDNCFFSSWMKSPSRAVLSCKQKPDLVGRWQVVALDGCCANFYPGTDCKLGDKAVRRIPLTRGKFVVVDAKDYYQLAQFKWRANKGSNTFYATGRPAGKIVKMHRWIMNAPAHLVVDHIDHNGLNNRRGNLRLCTSAQNSRNSVSRIHATSRYKGIRWDRQSKKWAVAIQSNKKKHYLGMFADEIQAAKAYDEKASQLHGQFACLNFPPQI